MPPIDSAKLRQVMAENPDLVRWLEENLWRPKDLRPKGLAPVDPSRGTRLTETTPPKLLAQLREMTKRRDQGFQMGPGALLPDEQLASESPPFGKTGRSQLGVETARPGSRNRFDRFVKRLGEVTQEPKWSQSQVKTWTKKWLGVALNKRQASELFLTIQSLPREMSPVTWTRRLVEGKDPKWLKSALHQAMRLYPDWKGKPQSLGLAAENASALWQAMRESKEKLTTSPTPLVRSPLRGPGYGPIEGGVLPPVGPEKLPALEQSEPVQKTLRQLRRLTAARAGQQAVRHPEAVWKDIVKQVSKTFGEGVEEGIHAVGREAGGVWGELPKDVDRAMRVWSRHFLGGRMPEKGSLLWQQGLQKAIAMTAVNPSSPEDVALLTRILQSEDIDPEDWKKIGQRFETKGFHLGRAQLGVQAKVGERQFYDEPVADVQARERGQIARRLQPAPEALRYRLGEAIQGITREDVAAFNKTPQGALQHGAPTANKILGVEGRSQREFLAAHSSADSLEKKIRYAEELKRWKASQQPAWKFIGKSVLPAEGSTAAPTGPFQEKQILGKAAGSGPGRGLPTASAPRPPSELLEAIRARTVTGRAGPMGRVTEAARIAKDVPKPYHWRNLQTLKQLKDPRLALIMAALGLLGVGAVGAGFSTNRQTA